VHVRIFGVRNGNQILYYGVYYVTYLKCAFWYIPQ
jgi:hypothetical protein